MTRDDIIRMAQEAGAYFDGECSVYMLPQHCFEPFAAMVAAAEQERIAKMFDKTWLNGRTVGDMIRERVQP